ncbi:Histone-lysine N-methyltransferase ATXR6 [Apostasia shenzhenica]|uniref:[histone H3]-lysine(27) N-methyltransferase n=1 Tax=Apostasia shenzhenica TaxID=1088818 RepID=A0A2I0AW55_9ASPA|nr:Histone-lysine N-methyltransferase ATXR6 [Apostasia shenzhenica]
MRRGEEEEAVPMNGIVRKRTAAPPPECQRKYRSMDDIMQAAKPALSVTEDYYSDVLCQQCRSGERENMLILCDRCDMGYHIYCLRPIVIRVPAGPWFCPSCTEEKVVRRFPLMQKKIVDFFRIQKCTCAPPKEECGSSNGGRKRKRRSTILACQKKRRRILPFIPSNDSKQRLKQMGSLATALTALSMEFTNDLIYMPEMACRSANKAILEKGGMQVLAKEDREALELCRSMYRRGECPPLIVVFDSCEGFTVQADEDIKDMTFITEYTGDVDYLENREHDDCDSMMTLLLATNPSHSLVICPDKRGNIARFINGINNHTQEGRKKQNLKCVRYDVGGECRVLLVACRDISRGERLYYDYNGYEQEYPTELFF